MVNSKELSLLLKELTILYIEDDEETKKEILQILNRFSSNVLSASNGIEALALYKNNDIQLIISDLEMPLMDGIEFIGAIRKDNISVPVIVLTAYNHNEYLFKCANLNIQAYIIKPIDFRKLKESLHTAVGYLNFTTNILLHINDHLTYDKINGILLENDTEYTLNKKEKILLDLLVENKNKIVTYEQIEQSVWYNYDEVMTASALRTIIKNLRKKSTDDFILNISGMGYKINTK